MIKRKKKTITKEQKLKNEIKEMQDQLSDANARAERWEGKYDALNEKIDDIGGGYRKLMHDIEGRMMPVAEERDWLRSLLELMVVDDQKLEKLREMQKNRVEPFNNLRGNY